MRKKIEAELIKGSGRGKKIGVPTFNFAIRKNFNLEYGIYAGYLIIKEKKYPSVIHYGPRPTFKEQNISLEVHVIDEIFSSPAFVKAKIEFIAYLRPVIDFASADDMVDEIKKDIDKAKVILQAESR